VRIVLLKEHGPEGFVWFTDYGSQKGQEIAENPRASLAFYWGAFSRQVRISGAVSQVAVADSRAYFATRPEDSRFSAAASDQSQPIGGREMLEARVAELRAQHPDGEVPMPEGWGGYCLAPTTMEFWQGREGRLHDRFRYTRAGNAWSVLRLQP
jgi:pyridoxamine 5'-phosphate oxidase